MKFFLRILGCVLLLSGLHGGALAQKLTNGKLEWGKPLPIKAQGQVLYNIVEDSEGVVRVSKWNKSRKLQVVNSMHEVTASAEIQPDERNRSFELILEIGFNNNILLLGSEYNNDTKRNELFLKRLERSSLELVSDWTKIWTNKVRRKANLSAIKAGPGIRGRGYANTTGDKLVFSWQQGGYDAKASPNGSKLIIYYLQPERKEEPQSFEYVVFNSDLQKEQERSLELKYGNKDFSVHDVELDDDGNVLLLGKFNSKSNKEIKADIRDKKSYYEYHLLRFTEGQANHDDFELRLGEKFLQQMSLKLDTLGNAYCLGFYSEEGTGSIRGSYYLKLNTTTGTVIKTSYNEFEDSFITMYLRDKEKEKTQKQADRKDETIELEDLILREIEFNSDGGLTVIAEQYNLDVSTTYSGMPPNQTQITTYRYFYKDVVVLEYSALGELNWKARIPKLQETTNDNGLWSGFIKIRVKDDMYFVFNDTRKNSDFQPGARLFSMDVGNKNQMLALVKIDSIGQQSRGAFSPAEEPQVMVIPRKSAAVGSKILLVSRIKKTVRYGIADFEAE